MSAFEALRALKNKVPWLTEPEEREIEAPLPPTPLEIAESLVMLARTPGHIDRTSMTWSGVARWAARELIAVQTQLETAADEKAAALRARAKTLRDMLAMDETELKSQIEDQAPYVP